MIMIEEEYLLLQLRDSLIPETCSNVSMIHRLGLNFWSTVTSQRQTLLLLQDLYLSSLLTCFNIYANYSDLIYEFYQFYHLNTKYIKWGWLFWKVSFCLSDNILSFITPFNGQWIRREEGLNFLYHSKTRRSVTWDPYFGQPLYHQLFSVPITGSIY